MSTLLSKSVIYKMKKDGACRKYHTFVYTNNIDSFKSHIHTITNINTEEYFYMLWMSGRSYIVHLNCVKIIQTKRNDFFAYIKI